MTGRCKLLLILSAGAVLAACVGHGQGRKAKPIEISPDLHYQTGMHMLTNGSVEQAAREFEAALVANPNHVDSLAAMGLVCFRRGAYTDAITYYKRALELNPSRLDVRVNLSSADLALESWEEALKEIEPVLAVTSYLDRSAALYNKGVALRHLGRLDEGVDSLREAIRLYPSFDRAYCELGRIYDLQGQYRLSQAQFRRCLELNPNNYLAYYGLGMVSLKLNEEAAAKGAFEKVIELAPASQEAEEVGRYLAAQHGS